MGAALAVAPDELFVLDGASCSPVRPGRRPSCRRRSPRPRSPAGAGDPPITSARAVSSTGRRGRSPPCSRQAWDQAPGRPGFHRHGVVVARPSPAPGWGWHPRRRIGPSAMSATAALRMIGAGNLRASRTFAPARHPGSTLSAPLSITSAMGSSPSPHAHATSGGYDLAVLLENRPLSHEPRYQVIRSPLHPQSGGSARGKPG